MGPTALWQAPKAAPIGGEAMEEPKYLVGQFLLAMPGMTDPRFDKAVIAMCVHDDGGALGIGLGRIMPRIGFHSLLEQLGIDKGVAPDVAIHHGGPVEPQRGFIPHPRSEERRVGHECVSTYRSTWTPSN